MRLDSICAQQASLFAYADRAAVHVESGRAAKFVPIELRLAESAKLAVEMTDFEPIGFEMVEEHKPVTNNDRLRLLGVHLVDQSDDRLAGAPRPVAAAASRRRRRRRPRAGCESCRRT